MMRKIIFPYIVMLSLLIACTESPESPTTGPISALPPTPEAAITTPVTPATPAIESPEPATQSISEEEMATLIWNELPDNLPDGYAKSQFLSQAGKATYIEDGNWEFQVSGNVSESKTLPQKNIEKTPGHWVLNRSREVTTYNLTLTAKYYEETGTLDIQGIQKSNGNTTVETTYEKPIIGRGLRVIRISGSGIGGDALRVEGAVENIGCVPLENVIIEVALFDINGKLVRSDDTTLSPNVIGIRERATFNLEIQQKLQGEESGEPGKQGKFILGSYAYRFMLSSGEELYVEDLER